MTEISQLEILKVLMEMIVSSGKYLIKGGEKMENLRCDQHKRAGTWQLNKESSWHNNSTLVAGSIKQKIIFIRN